jgi:Methylamine utilisation protein MauE
LIAGLLSPVELLISALLIWRGTIGGVLAALLLLVFSAAIAVTLRRGQTPTCHCFGQRSAQPIGTDTLVRNGVLFVLAIVAATQS